MKPKRYLARFYVTFLAVLGVCQVISVLVEKNLPLQQSREVFSFLYLTHVRNYGGVFGLAQGLGWLFAFAATVVLIVVIIVLHRGKPIKPIEYVLYGFIVGGGLSNVLDRLIYGSVIDYFDVKGMDWWTYIFNTADVCIHIGIWPLLILSFFQNKPALANSKLEDAT